MSDIPKNPLDDAMLGRKIAARWVICGRLRLDTAMHLGGSEGTERVDAPVLRDARSGLPLLPGTTLAGALRNALSERLAAAVVPLFGGERSAKARDGSQSPLIVFDARGELPTRPDASPGIDEEYGIEIRDGLAISPATGTAEDHKKYDYEVLPAGTIFPVRVDLLISELAEEKTLLEALASALDAFSHGENGFGAKRSRGLGRVSATWSAERFDLTCRAGWMKWLETAHCEPIGSKSPVSGIRDALEDAAPALRPLSLTGAPGTQVVFDLALEIAHDVLIRSPGTEAGAPDVSHLTSSGVPILSGTSLAGVMRAQALRIAGLVRDPQEANEWTERLFGPRFEDKRPSPGVEPHASRLRVSEARLTDTRPQQQTRVAIDRFTQGAVDGALFSEQPQVGGRAQVRLELRNPKEGEHGLVLLVVKDLLSGMLPVGGTSAIGRGIVTGTATVRFRDPVVDAPRMVTLEPGKPPAGDGADQIVRWIERFHAAPPVRATSRAVGNGDAA